jgi:DMSO reductase anchor subunit
LTAIENATGLGAIGRVSQWEVPHTSENYVQKEMGYAVARKHAAKLRRLVIVALALAIALLMASLVLPAAALPAAALALLAAAVERWLFFAEAQHVVTLFYGAKAA